MLKRKLLAVAVTGVISSGAMASSFHNQGSVLGYGDAGNNHTIFSNFKNPAFLGGDTTNREIGLGMSFGIDVEQKNTTAVGDNFDILNDELNAIVNPLTAEAEAEAEAAIDKFFNSNEAVSMALKISGSTPLVVQTTNYGGYMLAVSATSGTTINMIKFADADASTFAGSGDVADLETGRAMVFDAFRMTELSLAYSADLNRFFKPQNAQINAGVRFKSMTGGFNRSGMSFDGMLGGDEFGDQLSDSLENVTTFDETSTQLGVDLGLQYIAKNYLLGLSVENINSPTFKYNSVDQGAIDALTAGLVDKDITFEPKARIEAATYSQNRRWTFAGFADLTKTMDITGLETQKAGVSASYASNRWFLPDVRAGYTKEAAGNKMSRMHGGVTLGFLSVDVAANSFDFGEDVENSLAANVSVEFTF